MRTRREVLGTLVTGGCAAWALRLAPGDALLAQEKALLFILLEVGVCIGEQPPPR